MSVIQVNRQIFIVAAGLTYLLASSTAFATLTCPANLDVKDSACEQMQEPQKGQCKQKCATAKKDCSAAKKACQEGSAAEKGHIAEGQAASQGAGSSAGGTQGTGGTQAPNANNMCSGQKTNQDRANDGAPIPPAMQKCAASAAKCEDPSGPKAANEANGNAQKNAAENAARTAEAAEMGQKCDQSAKNENKMPSMPEMKMPEQKSDESMPETPSSISDVAETPPEKAEFKPETNQIGEVKFGNGVQANDVAMVDNGSDSALSGQTQSAYGTSGSSDGFRAGSGLGDITKGGGMASPGSVGSGASSLGGGSDGSKQKDGVAAADIKPESGNSFEVNSGGKSVLGLKGGKGDGDEVSVEDLAGIPSKGGGPLDDKSTARNLSGANQASAAGAGESGLSLFKMVNIRYRELRKVGGI